MKKIIFLIGGTFFLTILIGVSSIAGAAISNNNVGSIAEASNSNSTSILSNNSGTIGAESNGNSKPNVSNTTQTNADTTTVAGSDISNSELPDNAAQ